MQPALTPFASPRRHAAVADLIRRHSTNPSDIQQTALAGLDASTIREVLDLGCGFGLMAKVLGEHTAPDALIVGVDACPENREPFLDAVRAVGRRGAFEALRLASALPWADGSFDLVVASYSLYYFPGVLPEIPRVLRPTGDFVAVTHSEGTFGALCEAAGLESSHSALRLLLREFSAENAQARLAPHFARIERRDYPNTLRFARQHVTELLDYADFKLPLLVREGADAEALRQPTRRRLTALLEAEGRFVMDKHDAIFRCREPRGP